MTNPFLPVAAPVFAGNEKAYVNDCLDEGWVSSNGKYITKFEEAFAAYCGVRYAIGCCNGTVALHVALLAAGVGEGDEVLVPSLTFVATANAVRYCNATPVFVDSDPVTWNIDPADAARKVTPRTKAIIPVHLYGHPADMDPLRSLARKHSLAIIEDAAEAHGAEYKGRRTGGLGDLSTFSFYGNKVITCGEGGMVLADDPELADKVRLLRGQGMDPKRRYWFPVIGYNYRLTNIAAAIGLAQLERIDWHLEQRSKIAAWYAEELSGTSELTWQKEAPWARHANWMFTVLIEDASRRDGVMQQLAQANIETRPVFYPMHTLPPYLDLQTGSLPVCENIAARGINLPTSAGMSHMDVTRVCKALSLALK